MRKQMELALFLTITQL